MASSSAASNNPSSGKDLDPAEFVANIRKLGEKKDQEDAERLARLEEEIELGRREREMRRAGECVMDAVLLFVRLLGWRWDA